MGKIVGVRRSGVAKRGEESLAGVFLPGPELLLILVL